MLLFVRPVFRNLGGDSLDRFWHPLERLWSNFLDILEEFSNSFAPTFKDTNQMAPNGTNHTFKKNEQGLKDIGTESQAKHIVLTLSVLQSRVGPKPVSFNNIGSENL